jgi:porin
MKRFRLKLVWLILSALSMSTVAADDTTPDFSATLTGDWGGTRTEAANRGYVFEGGFKLDALRNRGGQSDGVKAVSHLDLKLKIDLKKAAGWEGGSAMINVLSNSGRGPAAQHVNNWMGITNIEVGTPTTTRLFQAWVQQSLLDDKLAVLAGLYPIDSEFFTMDSAGVFLGPQYGTPADLALTDTPSIFNNAAFGVRIRYALSEKLYAMGALMDGIPNDPDRPKRTAIRFAKDDGTFRIGEIGWLPEAGNDKFTGHAKIAAGLWSYSAKKNDFIDVDAAGNPVRRQTSGGYVLGERTLVQLGNDGEGFLSGFARYTWADANSTAVKNSLNLGLHLKGMVSSRPNDILGIAWTRAGLSGKWRVLQGAATEATETALEATYRYSLTPYLAIQPNLQYVRNPGGITGTPAARLIGIRFDVSF